MKQFLDSSRYMTLIGALALLAASLAALLWGLAKTYAVIATIAGSLGKDTGIAVDLIKVADAFLLALALYILATNVYHLFISPLPLPDWMLAGNLHDLKAKLSSVIILVLTVKFAETVVDGKDPMAALLTGAAVALVSGMLIAFSHFGGRD
jgi:uncharacterized membrane protein YqhA